MVAEKPALEEELKLGLQMETRIGDIINKCDKDKKEPEAKIAELKNDQVKMEEEFKTKKEQIEEDYKVLLAMAELEFNKDRAKSEDAISAQEVAIKTINTAAVQEIRQVKDLKDYRNKAQMKDLTKKLEDLNDATNKLRVAVKELKIDFCDCQKT